VAEAASYAGAATDLLIEARESIDTLLGDWAAHLQHEIGGGTGQALAYALKTPGKRVRAALVLGAYRSVRGGHKLNHAVLSALMADPSAWVLVEGPELRPEIRQETRQEAPRRTIRGHADLATGLVAPAYGPDVS
jgi:geranylgeranyl pyrophosphate synthase